MKQQNTLLFVVLIVFIISLTLGSASIVNKLESYQIQLTGEATTGRIDFTVQAVCGNSVCQATAENCNTCSEDCVIPSGNVCCSGQNITGNCCSSSDCSSGQVCTNNQCTSSTGTSDSGGGSGGGSGGSSEEPSPLSIIESIPPQYIETIFSNGEEITKLVNKIESDKKTLVNINYPSLSVQAIEVVTKETKTDVEVNVKELHTNEVYENTGGISDQVVSSGGNLEVVARTMGLTTEEVQSLIKVKDKINSAALKFIKISMMSNGEDVKIKDAKIKFSVEKEWLKEHDISEGEIRLARIRNGGWSYLETRKLGDDYNKIYYKAVTIEFSLFVITYERESDGSIGADEKITPKHIEIPLGLATSYIGFVVAILITLSLIYYQFFKLNKKVETRKLGGRRGFVKKYPQVIKEDEKREFIKGILKEALKQKKK